jgi:hypothetical protein
MHLIYIVVKRYLMQTKLFGLQLQGTFFNDVFGEYQVRFLREQRLTVGMPLRTNRISHPPFGVLETDAKAKKKEIFNAFVNLKRIL